MWVTVLGPCHLADRHPAAERVCSVFPLPVRTVNPVPEVLPRIDFSHKGIMQSRLFSVKTEAGMVPGANAMERNSLDSVVFAHE